MQTITRALKHWPSKITDSLLNREAVKKKSNVSNLPPRRDGYFLKLLIIYFTSYTQLNKQNVYS